MHDPYYSQISSQERPLHIKQTLMKWCSQMEENTEEMYTKHMWNPKVVGIKHLQHGLQRAMNDSTITMSFVCFMNEFYHIHIVIVKKGVAYETTWKDYPKTYIENKGTSYMQVSLDAQMTTQWITEFPEFDYDLKKGNLYKLPIEPISKYKVGDLKELAASYNVPVIANGKSVPRQALYDEISKSATRNLS